MLAKARFLTGKFADLGTFTVVDYHDTDVTYKTSTLNLQFWDSAESCGVAFR